MKTAIIASAIALFAAAGIALPHQAQAAGCLRGAVVGGVAGHFAGRHGLLGAGIGCAVGHHEANKRMREQRDYDRR